MHNNFCNFKRCFVILDTLVKNTDSFVCGTSKLVAISEVSFFSNFQIDEPIVNHDKLGTADHSSVDQDALFQPILSTCGTESCWLYTFSYSIIQDF